MLCSGFRGASGLEPCQGSSAATWEFGCVAAGFWATAREPEFMRDITISLARSSRVSVISVHLRIGTDRAVSSGACEEGESGDVCAELSVNDSLAFCVSRSTANSHCLTGSTAYFDERTTPPAV